MTILKSRLPAVAAALLMGSLAIAAPAFAETTDTDQTTQADTQATTDTDAAPAKPTEMMHHGKEDIEARIKTLHDKLKITADEENDWKTVAQTMRDNEAETSQLIAQRHENAPSMSAIDDLQSYQKIMQSHADALQKMVTAFQPLYEQMNDTQKKNADQVFGHFEGRHHDGQKKG